MILKYLKRDIPHHQEFNTVEEYQAEKKERTSNLNITITKFYHDMPDSIMWFDYCGAGVTGFKVNDQILLADRKEREQLYCLAFEPIYLSIRDIIFPEIERLKRVIEAARDFCKPKDRAVLLLKESLEIIDNQNPGKQIISQIFKEAYGETK